MLFLVGCNEQPTNQLTQTISISNIPTQKSVVDIKVGYKNLNISDGIATFSFQIPEKWVTETRHSGEKQLTIEEMKAFIATSSNGDIKTNSTLYSDYADLLWSDIQKMSTEELKQTYSRSNDLSNPYPTVSVSAGDYILYSDLAWQQIDFYLKNETSSNLITKIRQEKIDNCKRF